MDGWTMSNKIVAADLLLAAEATNKAVVQKRKYDHETQILCSLHWLPDSFRRIEFKLLLITHKCLQGTTPIYLSSLIHRYTLGRSLQSADQFLLVEKKARLRTSGDRAFSFAAPHLWNKLPLELRKCKSLDTFRHIYSRVFFRCNWTVIFHCIVLLYSMWLDLCDFIYLLYSDLTLWTCVVFYMYMAFLNIFRVFIFYLF